VQTGKERKRWCPRADTVAFRQYLTWPTRALTHNLKLLKHTCKYTYPLRSLAAAHKTSAKSSFHSYQLCILIYFVSSSFRYIITSSVDKSHSSVHRGRAPLLTPLLSTTFSFMTSVQLQTISRRVQRHFSNCLLYFLQLCLCSTKNVKTMYKNPCMYSNKKHPVLESPCVPSLPVPLKSEPHSQLLTRQLNRLLLDLCHLTSKTSRAPKSCNDTRHSMGGEESNPNRVGHL
jgi:hypothetical protein